MAEPLRVAIVGGGVGGSAAVRSISKRFGTRVAVSLFEMGRGLGGRAATRKSRDDARIMVSHGCPAFEASDAGALGVCEELEAAGHLRSSADGGGGGGGDGGVGAGTGGGDSAVAARVFHGHPGMNSLCEGLVEGCPFTPRFKQMVRKVAFDAASKRWLLQGGDEESLGEYDWLIVSGSGLAHPRWTKTFGSSPPLLEAAGRFDPPCDGLDRALAVIGEMEANPVVVAMMMYENGGGGGGGGGEDGKEGVAAAAASLSCDSAVIKLARAGGGEGKDGEDGGGGESAGVLTKAVVQRGAGNTTNVVLHSTHQYALSIADVYGRTSTAARLGGAKADSTIEDDIVAR
jgi:hypothetical protein